MTHETWLQKKKCFWLKDTNQDVVWATHPVNMHGTPSKHQTLLRDWEIFRGCSPRPDFVKLFLPRQRPFWAFIMDSRRELLQTLLPRSHSTTFPKFIRRQSVVTLLVAFLLLRWAGEGRLCFLALYWKLLKVGLVDPRSLDLQGLEAFAGLSRSLGSGLVNDVATRQERKHLHQTFAADVYKQHSAAVGCGL